MKERQKSGTDIDRQCIPDVTDNLQSPKIDPPILGCEINCKTVPPVSILTEQQAEELVWVKVYQIGKNVLQESSAIAVTVFSSR